MAYQNMLKKIELFTDLNEAELQAVEKCVSESRVEAGTVVIEEGKAEGALYLVLAGKVQVTKRLGEEEIAIAELGEGKAFGEMSLLDDFPPSATVRTVQDSVFLAISRLDLNVLLHWDTVLAAKMWRSFTRMLCARLRDTNERMLAGLAAGKGGGKVFKMTRDALALAQGSKASD